MVATIQRGLTREDDFKRLVESLPSDVEMAWGKGLSSEEVREKEPFKTLFSGLEYISERFSQIASVLSSLIDLLSSVVDILTSVIGIAVDLIEGFVLAIEVVISQIKQLFDGTSLSLLSHFPTEMKKRRTPSEILYDVGMSYLDNGDPNKPLATTRTAYGITLVALFSAPDPRLLIESYNKIKESITGTTNSVSSTLSGITDTKSSSVRPSDTAFSQAYSGVAPDWAWSGNLSDLNVFKGITSELGGALSDLKGSRAFAAKINASINLVRQKASNVERIVNNVLQAYSSLVALLSLGDSNGLFLVKGNGNNSDFARAIINAPNHQDYPKADLNDLGYNNFGGNSAQARALGERYMFSGAFVLHLQSGGSQASLDLLASLIDAVFSPIASSVTDTDKALSLAKTQEIENIRDAAGNIKSKYNAASNAKKQLNQGLGG